MQKPEIVSFRRFPLISPSLRKVKIFAWSFNWQRFLLSPCWSYDLACSLSKSFYSLFSLLYLHYMINLHLISLLSSIIPINLKICTLSPALVPQLVLIFTGYGLCVFHFGSVTFHCKFITLVKSPVILGSNWIIVASSVPTTWTVKAPFQIVLILTANWSIVLFFVMSNCIW